MIIINCNYWLFVKLSEYLIILDDYLHDMSFAFFVEPSRYLIPYPNIYLV